MADSIPMIADSGSRRRLHGVMRPGLRQALTLGGRFAQAVSLQGEAVGVVDEAVEDGVGDGRIADDLVPVIDGQLAGHDGRAAAVPIVDDLEEIAALLGRQRREAPVVEDQQLDAGQGLEQPGVAAVAACERKASNSRGTR